VKTTKLLSIFRVLTLSIAIVGSALGVTAHGADEIIKPGTSYAAARKHLLSRGYAPIQFPKQQCLDNASGRAAVCEAYPETTFCSGTGLANCQFALRGPKGELLLIETEGEERATPGHDIGLDLGVKRARLATSDERAQLPADAQNKTQDSSKAQSLRDAFVQVYSTDNKKVISTKLRAGDFQSACLNDDGATSWENPKYGEYILTCVHGTNGEYSNVFHFKYIDRARVQVVRQVNIAPDGTFTSTPGELYAYVLYVKRSLPDENAGGSFVPVSGEKLTDRHKMYTSDVNYYDAQGRLINAGINIYAFGRECGRLNGKFSVQEEPDTLFFSCTRTLDFIEHPNMKPTRTTFTYTFKDKGHLILLEGISTNQGQKLLSDQIEQIVTNIPR